MALRFWLASTVCTFMRQVFDLQNHSPKMIPLDVQAGHITQNDKVVQDGAFFQINKYVYMCIY